MANGFKGLGKLMIATYVDGALAALRSGDVRTAHDKAVRACEMRPSQEHLQKLGLVFYAHGKLLTSEGRLDEATAAFSRAVKCAERCQAFRLRSRAAETASRHPSRRTVPRRLKVRSFCSDMGARINLSLSSLPAAPFLHVVRKAGYLNPPIVALRGKPSLEEFHALGTYRWQGDQNSSDRFTQWVRRLKNGDRTVAEHLGLLLGDWIWAETAVLRDADFLVTVPADPQRQGQRGFNPPDVLAEAIQERLGIPVLKDVLARSESSRARELSYADVRESFHHGREVSKIRGWNVLLLDDVATRGHTLRACSEHLHIGGARRVICVALAQAVTTHREREATRALGTPSN